MKSDHLPSFLKILFSVQGESSANLLLGILTVYSLGNFKKLLAMIFECSEGVGDKTVEPRAGERAPIIYFFR